MKLLPRLFTVPCILISGIVYAQRSTLASLIDTSNTTVLAFSNKPGFVPANVRSGTLTNADIKTIDSLVEYIVNTHHIGDTTRFRDVKGSIGIQQIMQCYGRQLFCDIDAKGEKEVWVNCLCLKPFARLPEWVEVGDGGDCYFTLHVNLVTRTLVDFNINATE